MARLFDIIAALMVVFALANGVARGRSFHFDERDVKSEDAAILAAASQILNNGLAKELTALDAAVEDCLKKGTKKNQDELVLKTLDILRILEQTGSAIDTIQGHKSRRTLLGQYLERRGSAAEIKDTLSAGQKFLNLLTEDQRKAYLKAYSKFAAAPKIVQQAYLDLVIKYAKKCAARENIYKRTYFEDSFDEDFSDEKK